MDDYSQDYGNYFHTGQHNSFPDDDYYFEEQRRVSTSNSGMHNAQEDYDMYDDVDELLNDIGRCMRSKNMYSYSHLAARSSPSPPDRSLNSRPQVLMSPQYRQTAQHHEYRNPSPHMQYEEAHEMYDDEPFEEQPEPSSYRYDPPRSEIQFKARPSESRTCEALSCYNELGYIMLIWTHDIP